MSAAERSQDKASRDDYTKVAKMASFNIAANCWPGWGADEAATITDEQRRLGAEFAEIHLSITLDLKLAADKISGAHWHKGAHQLAAGAYDAARETFTTCAELAVGGAAESEEMAKGWITVVDVLQGADGAEARLESIKSRLMELGDDGEFYASQYDPALSVFQARS